MYCIVLHEEVGLLVCELIVDMVLLFVEPRMSGNRFTEEPQNNSKKREG